MLEKDFLILGARWPMILKVLLSWRHEYDVSREGEIIQSTSEPCHVSIILIINYHML